MTLIMKLLFSCWEKLIYANKEKIRKDIPFSFVFLASRD
jgi:hypothetical protein